MRARLAGFARDGVHVVKDRESEDDSDSPEEDARGHTGRYRLADGEYNLSPGPIGTPGFPGFRRRLGLEER